MNDYNELIKELRKEFNNCDDLISQKIALNLTMASDRKYAILAEDCCSEMPGIMQTISCAVDAIERLIKERDAAIADLSEFRVCKTCKNLHDGICTKLSCSMCNKWEWRGMIEE